MDKKLHNIIIKMWSGIKSNFKAEGYEIDNGDLFLYIGSTEIARVKDGYWACVGIDTEEIEEVETAEETG